MLNNNNEFSIYLITNNSRYLIVDNTISAPFPLTGFTTLSVNETTTTLVNSTTTTLVNSTTTTLESTTTTTLSQSFLFEEACSETCSLSNMDKNIILEIKINNSILILSNITYTILVESPPIIIESLIQGSAEVGKSVSWTKTINIENINSYTTSIHKEASNIQIIKDGIQVSDTSIINLDNSTNITFNSPGIYLVSYKTPAPTITEETKGNRKIVKVNSDISYTNVLVHANIDELKKDLIKIYWNSDSGRKLITNVTYFDQNDNGLIESVSWIAPHLSEQVFEIFAESTTANFVVDLSVINVTMMVWGANGSDELGSRIVVKDINNDSAQDIIIKSGATFRPVADGEVFIIYGKNYTKDDLIDLDLQKANITIKAANDSEILGSSLASGDINNDGFNDILIGASDANSTAGLDVGAGYVLYGSANYANEKVFDLDLVKANITIKGANASDGLGDSSWSEDINNDGIDDMIIGASDANSTAAANVGKAYVIYGSANYANEKVFDLFSKS